jgi:hypothetical protein
MRKECYSSSSRHIGPTDHQVGWSTSVCVELSEGDLGSLRLADGGQTYQSQVFGRRAAEYEFTDTDGVKVIAFLNLNQNGIPYELDVWKVDLTHTDRLQRGRNPG